MNKLIHDEDKKIKLTNIKRIELIVLIENSFFGELEILMSSSLRS